jgi:hypothetical protein
MNQPLRTLRSTARWAVVFASRKCRGENLVEWAAGMSTGLAQEMQKGSGQWPVVSFRYQVFGGRSWVFGFTLRRLR